jgi:hypothetical protein
LAFSSTETGRSETLRNLSTMNPKVRETPNPESALSTKQETGDGQRLWLVGSVGVPRNRDETSTLTSQTTHRSPLIPSCLSVQEGRKAIEHKILFANQMKKSAYKLRW